MNFKFFIRNRQNIGFILVFLVVLPMILWIFVFLLRSDTSWNAAPALCLTGLLFPSFLISYVTLHMCQHSQCYLLKAQRQKISFNKLITKKDMGFLGGMLLINCGLVFIATLINLGLFGLFCLIPGIDPNGYFNNAMNYVFHNRDNWIWTGVNTRVWWTILMSLLSIMLLSCVCTLIGFLWSIILNGGWAFLGLSIFMLLSLIFSDVLFIPDVFTHNAGLTNFSYIFSTKAVVWTFLFSMSSGVKDGFLVDGYYYNAITFFNIWVALAISVFWFAVIAFLDLILSNLLCTRYIGNKKLKLANNRPGGADTHANQK